MRLPIERESPLRQSADLKKTAVGLSWPQILELKRLGATLLSSRVELSVLLPGKGIKCLIQLLVYRRAPGGGATSAYTGFRVQGPGFRVQGPGFRVQGSGFRVQGSGFRVQGSGFRVQGSGFRVQG